MPSVNPGNLSSHLEGYGSSDNEQTQASGLASHVGAYGSDSGSDMDISTPSEADNAAHHPPALDIAASEPYRLQNRLADSSYPTNSPTTPTEEEDRNLFDQYSSPATLPPAHDDPSKPYVSFGSVEVPRAAAADYQQLRLHSIQARAGRKTLYAAEQTLTKPQPGQSEGIVDRVRVYPYLPGNKLIHDLDGTPLPAKNAAFLTKNDAGETIGNVTFDAREGLFTPSGGQQSAATGGLHELRHLVVEPGTGPAMAGFTNEQEHHTIIDAENPVAKANNEEPRDTHGDAGHYQTDHIRSTNPVDPRTGGVISEYSAPLREATAKMDRQNLGSGHVNHPDVIARQKLARAAANQIKIFERRRQGDTGSISSAGHSDRSGNSVSEGSYQSESEMEAESGEEQSE